MSVVHQRSSKCVSLTGGLCSSWELVRMQTLTTPQTYWIRNSVGRAQELCLTSPPTLLPYLLCLSVPSKKPASRPWLDGTLGLWVQVKVTQSCPTFCHRVDYSPPGSSVHGILQARILEWVAFPFSRGSSQPKDRALRRNPGLHLCRQILYCLTHLQSAIFSDAQLSEWSHYSCLKTKQKQSLQRILPSSIKDSWR